MAHTSPTTTSPRQALRGALSMYDWRYPRRILSLFASKHYHAWKFLRIYWTSNGFASEVPVTESLSPVALSLLYCIAILEIVAAIVLIAQGVRYDLVGGLPFDVALLIGYPVVIAHLMVVPVLLWRLVHPKALGKAFLLRIMTKQVIRLREQHRFTVVAVAGSVGKTSTKIAIARLLQTAKRVRWQEGNYNDPLTVPLIFFGHTQPALFNIFAWCKILLANQRMIKRAFPYDIVVAELGTDTPGTVPQFAYLRPEVAVVTAVTPEHMEYFGTLDAVAAEELAVLTFAEQTLINIDDTPKKYIAGQDFLSYGLHNTATYYATKRSTKGWNGQQVTFVLGKDFSITKHISLLGEQGAKVATAAVATARVLGLSKKQITDGIDAIAAFAGRMQVLPGIQNSTLIDDTYNATPIAAKAALDVVYAGDAPQRIAILGSMNELGDYTEEAHREVGAYCDPTKLDWVITIGPDAKKHLAPAAKAQGCQVKAFDSPHIAGRFVKEQLKDGAVVLAKGSQNRVFAEEALKPLLADPADIPKLVRQSAYWARIKRQQFGE